jgi:hypothetical protein
MIQLERVRPLNNEKEKRRDFVLNWMQASQRADASARKYEVKNG